MATALLALTSFQVCHAEDDFILRQRISELENETLFQAQSKNYTAALNVNELAIAVVEPNRNLYPSQLANIYFERFRILRQIGQFDGAYIMAMKAGEMQKKIPSSDGINYSLVLRELAEMLAGQGKLATAEKFSLDAVKHIEGKPGRDTIDTSSYYLQLSKIYVRQEKFDQAELVLNKALAAAGRAIDPKSEWAARAQVETLTELSKLYAAQGKTAQAQQADKQRSEIVLPSTMATLTYVKPDGAYVPVRVSDARCKKPKYTDQALQQAMQGTTRFRFLVDEKGDIVERYVSASSGFHELDMATLKSYAKCDFFPATSGGKAIRAWYSGEFAWTLPG